MRVIPFNRHCLGFEDPNKYNDFARFNLRANDGVLVESSWFDDVDVLSKSKGIR